MAALVSPIVDIILRLWTGCARHTRYLCELERNKILLSTAMDELKEARDDVQMRVVQAESDANEPKKRTDPVRGWLERVQIIEGEMEMILQKADEQLSRARCLGGCCPPNNCWSNYKLGKSIAKKIPLVDVLKGKGHFEELTYKLPPSFVEEHTSYLSKLQENKILLSTAIDELKETRNDVQRKVVEAEADPSEPNMRTDQVRGWLQRVEIIESEVEVILQKADAQLSRAKCLGGCCPPNNCCSDYKVGKSITMKITSVLELKGKGHFEELTYRLPPPSVQDMNLESTVGMEFMFDKVWRLINSTNDTQPISNIIGLYGQGGVGKTTLLKKINNEFKISNTEHNFNHIVIFVVVSKLINYHMIQTTIGARLGFSNSLQRDGDENSRAQKILNGLTKKNYVLLLDDIWEKVDFHRIGIPIHPQGNSKIIFTTRNKLLCGLMEAKWRFQVECLPWDKAWNLFQDKVGEKALNCFPGARGLAELVAKECDGLPLALTTLGRAMSTKRSVEEWKDAITTLRNYASEFEGMCDEVLPRLKPSYDYLRNNTIKSCFRYCALYPEDYSIEIVKLVDLWIAEGFLDGFDNLVAARNRGNTIIRSLMSACLLERGEGNCVKMHDVIRDLAIWIVNDCRSSDESGSTPNNKYLVAVNGPCKKWENATRIFWEVGDSINEENNNQIASYASSNPNYSRSLLLDGSFIRIDLYKSLVAYNGPYEKSKYWEVQDRIKEEENKQILAFEESVNRIFNQSIENKTTSPNLLTLIMVQKTKTLIYVGLSPSFFQHMPLLRVLDLSNTQCIDDDFPISICELHELQYLNLSWTGIKELSVELRKLVKLKYLILRNTSELRRIPEGVIENLSELQVLDLSYAHDSGFQDWEVEDGPSLSELDGLTQLQEVQITIRTSVALKRFLGNRKLQMVCTDLNYIDYTYGLSTPSRRVLDLNYIDLNYRDCTYRLSTPSRRVLDLSKFRSLKYLNIKGFHEMQELELYGGLLSNLALLTLDSLFWLHNILWMAAAQPDLLCSHFQSLNRITIVKCHSLKDLAWLVYVQNLTELYVWSCMDIETIIELGDDGLEGGDQILLNTGGVFRRLKILFLDYLQKLKSICRHALAFPSIQDIQVSNCPELKKLPLGSCSNANNTLKWIRGSTKWWNELQWEDETIKSKFLPYLNK